MSNTTASDEAASSTGTVTVTPERFTMVAFDAATIAEVAGRVWEQVGLPAGTPLQVDVDETTPLGRAWVSQLDPPVLKVESGGLEHNHQPRQFNPDAAAQLFARLMLRVRDRMDPAFGDPPPDDDLSLELSAAWDAYSMGRVERLGYDTQRPRRLYQFRVRHSFTDVADAAFAELWSSDSLTWADIERLSAQALAASQ